MGQSSTAGGSKSAPGEGDLEKRLEALKMAEMQSRLNSIKVGIMPFSGIASHHQSKRTGGVCYLGV
jgi:hypothetical protein